MRHYPSDNRNKGITLIQVLVIFVSISLLGYLCFWLHQKHALTLQMICSANMKGIGTGMSFYAHDAGYENWMKPDMLPEDYHYDVLPGGGDGTLTYPDRTMPIPITSNGVHISSSRYFWALLSDGENAPECFICPASDDTIDPKIQNPSYYDFASPTHISYSFNVSLLHQSESSANFYSSRTPVVADKGPYGSKQDTHLPPDSIKTSSRWRRYNSPNHNGRAQIVLFGDGHNDWITKPFIGPNNDNIYTTAASCTNSNPLLTGVSMWTARDLPYDWYDPKHNPYAATDALIFP